MAKSQKDIENAARKVNTAMNGEGAFNGEIAPVPRKSMKDFQRDVDQKNVLVKGRWGVRGCLSMFVSTTGSGKSVLQTQLALCFAAGVPCVGLEPVRPFRVAVCQSEDDSDRLALDRDDVVAYLTKTHPDVDWTKAIEETSFWDFTGKTGVDFIQTLNNELYRGKPDAIIINPYNAFMGGDPVSHRDVSAFLKGGYLDGQHTEGLEAVFKRHEVWGLIFAHTPKPPSPSEIYDWVNDPYSCYKSCGSSALPDAVRSIVTFLQIPGSEGRFVFHAGKNGRGLKWVDREGKRTIRNFFQWGAGDSHYWTDVPAAELSAVEDLLANCKTSRAKKKSEPPPAPPPRDETDIVRDAFVSFGGKAVTHGTAVTRVMAKINVDRAIQTPPVKPISRDATRDLLEVMAERGIIRMTVGGGRDNIRWCGFPDVVAKHLRGVAE